MLELAKAYEMGLGVTADAAQAKAWRERAAAKADPAARKSDAGNQRADPRPAKR
jgi:TPR repeat protein